MDGLPTGVPGLPPPDSTMSLEHSRQYVQESLDKAERIYREVNGEIAQQAVALLDDAYTLYGNAMQDEYNAVQELLHQAEKRMQRVANADAKAAGDYIQQAYDTIRLAGHNPITQYTEIERLSNEQFPFAETVSLMLGGSTGPTGGGIGDVPELRRDIQGIPQSGSSDTAQGSQGTETGTGIDHKEATLERWARNFGESGETLYEIARYGFPSPKYPDDNYVPPAGTPVIPHDGSGWGPDGYVYNTASGGYIPGTALPPTPLPVPQCPPDMKYNYLTQQCERYIFPHVPLPGEDISLLGKPPPVPPPSESPPPPIFQPPPTVPGVPPLANPPPLGRNPQREIPPSSQTGCFWTITAEHVERFGMKEPKQVYSLDELWEELWRDCIQYQPLYHQLLRYVQNLGEGSVYLPGCGEWNYSVQQVCPPDRQPTVPPPTPVPPPSGTTQPTTGKCYMLVECAPPTVPTTPLPPQPIPPSKVPESPPPPPPLPPSKFAPDCKEYDEYMQWLAQTSLVMGKAEPGDYIRHLIATNLPDLPSFTAAFVQFITELPKAFGSMMGGLASLLGNTDPLVVVNAYTINSAAGMLGMVTGTDPSPITEPIQQALRHSMPYTIPPQPALDTIWLTDYITTEQWEHSTKALGNRPGMAACVRDAAQARLNIQEVIDLYMRGALLRSELDEELRKRGVIDPENVKRWLFLRQALPTETDLIPFMVRDVVNPNINWELSDAWFEQNYRGIIREWGDKLGIDPQVMQMRARQHWQLPSNTALYEMMARLRPGNRKDGLEVSYEDARKLLQQNDMEPSWIDKVLAIAYLPPTRTDIKQGIKTRSIKTIEEAVKLLRDARIDPEYAPVLARILWDDAQRQTANESNLWSRAKIFKAYKEGVIGRERAAELLRRFVPDESLITQQLDDADAQAADDVQRECLKAVKQRLMKAELTTQEAVAQLEELGIPSERATQLVRGYLCYRDSRGSELTLRYLRKIWLQGLIAPEALYIRFRNLRYTEEDSQLLVQSWALEFSEAQRKDAERELQRRITETRSARSRYRTEVAWLQKQRDRLAKQREKPPPGGIDAVDTGGQYVPPNPQPPIP